ncbi:hypothetical protein GSY71_07735 [Pusillimonas sp. TS35]|nr:hypothetical protein [Paracandidimonas lactea]MYN13037.1 hypothetical protein [Pusillimonas sp. TS35]
MTFRPRPFSELLEHATRLACAQVVRAIDLDVQDVAEREAYARAKPG